MTQLKLSPCLGAVKRRCPFSDQDFMTIKARARMAQEQVQILLDERGAHSDLATAVESSTVAQKLVNQLASDYRPCRPEAFFSLTKEGTLTAQLYVCADCKDLPRYCSVCKLVLGAVAHFDCAHDPTFLDSCDSALHSILFFTGEVSQTKLKKILRASDRKRLERMVDQFQLHHNDRVNFKKQRDVSFFMPWLLEQTTGKFVLRSDGICFAWDADEQVLFDPRDFTKTLISSSTHLPNIDRVYQLSLFDPQEKLQIKKQKRKDKRAKSKISKLNSTTLAVVSS